MFKLKLLSISTIFIPLVVFLWHLNISVRQLRFPAVSLSKQSDACGKQLSGYGLAKLFVDPRQQADR